MEDELKKLLGQADDDYLIGLGNKGILKRAYKDLEQESPAADWQQGEVQDKEQGKAQAETQNKEQAKARGKEQAKVQVKLSEETCVICAPLGESTCTCPSRSICRHIVTAILWLKGNLDAGGSGGADKPKFSEFLEIPMARLVKACGASHFRKFLAHVRTGGLPQIEASSIVTVELPWEQAVVKLLEPLSYSSCTCHSKELCTHKAQALLAWRLREGACTLQELETGQEAEGTLDLEQVREACESIRETVRLHLCTGLSRQSPEASVSMERLAVICHRAGLADMERSLRGAAAEYTQYFERQARFREEELLDRLLGLYALAGYMLKEERPGELQKIAGTFRDTYEFAGKLRLVGIGSRSFQSKTGYEGEIYYFLDEASERYLTWTDARPMFYEGTGRRPVTAPEHSQAPWGLNCSREQLFQAEIELSDARLAPGGRLSASQETKGELLGAKSLYDEEISRRIVWDYTELLKIFGASEFEAYEGAESGGDETEDRIKERLALLGAVRWGEAVFDKAMQRFSWELFDLEGHCIYVSLKYTKEEKFIIRLLERLEKRVREGNYASLVLFGALYLQEGRLCLYPIEFWLQEDDRLLSSCGKELPADKEAFEGKEITADKEVDAVKKTAAEKEMMPDKKTSADKEQTHLPSEEALDTMEQYLKDAGRQLADLFVSGLTSSSEELEGRILACAREGEELGLHYAGKKLAELGELLKGRHHQMEFSPEPLLEVWEGVQRYLKVCGEKVSLDRARLSVEGAARRAADGVL